MWLSGTPLDFSVLASPATMLRIARPPENWSKVAVIFAASTGEISGGWTAIRKRIRSVSRASVEASTHVSCTPVANSAPE